MKKRKSLHYLIIAILLVILSVVGFYLYLGYQFGKGVSKFAEVMIKVEKELDSIVTLDFN